MNIKINGGQIEKLITKYYFKGERLCFSILVQLKDEQNTLPYKQFDDYGVYKKEFNHLLAVRNENLILEM